MTKEKREQLIKKTKEWVMNPRTWILGAVALTLSIIDLTNKKKLTTENVNLKQTVASEAAKNIVLSSENHRLGRENSNLLYQLAKSAQEKQQMQIRRAK